MPTAAFAEDLGRSIPIQFTKIWEGTASGIPESITVTLYRYLGEFNISTASKIEQATITGPNWMHTFHVPEDSLFSQAEHSADNVYKFKIVESPVSGYEETAHTDPAVNFAPLSLGKWERITPCSEVNITTTGNLKSIIVAKTTKNGPIVVWTPDSFTAAEQSLIISSANGLNGLGNPAADKFVFVYGFGKFSEYGITVTETQIQFADESAWALFGTTSYVLSSTSVSSCSITNSAVTDTATVHDSITVNKVDERGNALDGATFTVYSDRECTNAVTTFTAGSYELSTDRIAGRLSS